LHGYIQLGIICMKVFFYTSANKKSPLTKEIDTLNLKDKAKLLACLESVKDIGLESGRVQFRQIEGKLWEIKINLSSGGYRIFYILLSKSRMILLHIYKKQSQRAPRKELEVAFKRMKELEENESNYT